jgi:hypothetical protein
MAQLAAATATDASEVSIADLPYSGYVDAIVYLFYEESSFASELFVHTRNANPKIPMVFIGKSNLAHYAQTFDMSFVDMDSLSVDLSYNYTHFSPNDPAYEKRRFDRWLLLDAYMKTSTYTKILYSDYDNTLFAEVNKLTSLFTTPDIVYVGNNNVCVPNILFMTNTVTDAIASYIRAFYGRETEAIQATIASLPCTDADGITHYSDIWMLRDVFANLARSNPVFVIDCPQLSNVYQIDKTTTPFLIDANYWKVRHLVFMMNGAAHIQGQLVYNMYFNGDDKKYPYGEN